MLCFADFCEKISTKMGELTFAMRTVSDRLDRIERIININQLPGQNNNHDEFVALLPLETIEGVTEFEERLIGDVVPRLVGTVFLILFLLCRLFRMTVRNVSVNLKIFLFYTYTHTRT